MRKLFVALLIFLTPIISLQGIDRDTSLYYKATLQPDRGIACVLAITNDFMSKKEPAAPARFHAQETILNDAAIYHRQVITSSFAPERYQELANSIKATIQHVDDAQKECIVFDMNAALEGAHKDGFEKGLQTAENHQKLQMLKREVGCFLAAASLTALVLKSHSIKDSISSLPSWLNKFRKG